MANFVFKHGIRNILDQSISTALNPETAFSIPLGLRVALMTTALTKAAHGDATQLVQADGSSTMTFTLDSGTSTGTEFSTTGTYDKQNLAGMAWVTSATGGTGIHWTNLARPIAYFDFEVVPDASTVILQWGGVTGHVSSGTKGIVLKVS